MVTDVVKWHREPPASKLQIQDYQYRDRLSVCRVHSLQRKPKLGRTKASIGPHVAQCPRDGRCSTKIIRHAGTLICLQWYVLVLTLRYTVCRLFGKNKTKFGQKRFPPKKICTPVHLCSLRKVFISFAGTLRLLLQSYTDPAGGLWDLRQLLKRLWRKARKKIENNSTRRASVLNCVKDADRNNNNDNSINFEEVVWKHYCRMQENDRLTCTNAWKTAPL